jgi:hypothetical protein
MMRTLTLVLAVEIKYEENSISITKYKENIHRFNIHIKYINSPSPPPLPPRLHEHDPPENQLYHRSRRPTGIATEGCAVFRFGIARKDRRNDRAADWVGKD